MVVVLAVGMRRVDVRGTELTAEEEALGDGIAPSCLVVGAELSIDCDEVDWVAVAFAAGEGSNEPAEVVELPVRVIVPNAESEMVMGKWTPDDSHRVLELVSTTSTTVSTTVVVGVCASWRLITTSVGSAASSRQVIFDRSQSASLDRTPEAKNGSLVVSTSISRFESASASLAPSRCLARMSLLIRSWRWPW